MLSWLICKLFGAKPPAPRQQEDHYRIVKTTYADGSEFYQAEALYTFSDKWHPMRGFDDFSYEKLSKRLNEFLEYRKSRKIINTEILPLESMSQKRVINK